MVSLTNKLLEIYSCAVCLEANSTAVFFTKCGHEFHEACAKKILASGGICSICREGVKEFKQAYVTRQAVAALLESARVTASQAAVKPVATLEQATAKVQKVAIEPFRALNVVKNTQSFFWPQDLDCIKMTQEEQEITECTIRALQRCLPQDTKEYIAHSTIKHHMTINLGDGSKKFIPRSLIVSHHRAIVKLNQKGGMPTVAGGAHQQVMKFAYDAFKGQMLIKKKLFSQYETALYYYLQHCLASNQDMTGLAEIVHVETINGILRVFERQYSCTLAEYMQSSNPKMNIPRFLEIQTGLRTLHSVNFRSASISQANGTSHSRGYYGSCYHGDVSPNNIMIAKDSETGDVSFKLIDFAAGGSEHNVFWTPGWGSPEAIQFAKRLNFQQCNVAQFNVRYGQKKDTWAYGLLLGSMLRGGFHPKHPGLSLPCFSFIEEKIKVSEGKIDDSGIAGLTQKEIDDKLDEIVAAIDPDHSERDSLIALWNVVKAWLRVDPEKRPSVTQCYLNVGSPEK